jgi:hypothetical protein
MIRDRLIEEFFRILEKSGRDWHRIHWAIRGLEAELLASLHADEAWAPEEAEPEEAEYIEWRICEALALARREAVAREEFEWAHEITVRLVELGWTEEDELKINPITDEDSI